MVHGDCLVDADTRHFIFFVEDTGSVTIDLNDMPGPQALHLVDTRAESHEINKGTVAADVHTIQLGAPSDWAIMVGPP